MHLAGPDWNSIDARERSPHLQAFLERCPEYFLQDYGRLARPDEAEQLIAEGPPAGTPAEKVTRVLVRDGAVFGALDLLRGYRREREAYLGLLLLAPEARGRGTGRAVLAALEAALAADGFDSLRLVVTEQNEAGRRFWASRGFRLEKVFPPRLNGARDGTVLHEFAKPLVRRI